MGITVYVDASGKLTVRIPISKLADKDSMTKLQKAMENARKQ